MPPKNRIYVALSEFCRYDRSPRSLLDSAGFEIQENTLGRRLKPEEIPSLLRDSEAVIAGVEPYTTQVLEALPKLRLISRCGIGTDSIDLETARRHGISVLTTGDEVVEPVAQMALAMILALARNLPLHAADFRAGEWKKHTGHLLSEWTIGLIGFGRIGKALHRILRPFACRVLVYDPHLPDQRIPEGVESVDLPTLLKSADLVSLHASPPAGGPPLLGREELAQMRPGARLVNTARGRLVDEEALLEALESGRLAAAALDVFADEPYAGSLSRLPQVLCTPHVSSLTVHSRSQMELRSARNVVEFFQREKT